MGREVITMKNTEFQSTHPSRGATGEVIMLDYSNEVSIHAPLAGCDPPTGATWDGFVVSIHAPLAGCDAKDRSICYTKHSFNPRTPRGVRPARLPHRLTLTLFQSTHPSRGATANGPTKGTFCHVFMGVTRHKYDFSRRFVPRPSFGTVLPPIFYHAIFCSLHLRAHKEPLR